MKKIILLIAAAALSTAAFAQSGMYSDWSTRGWRFGVKAGVNFSNTSDMPVDDTKMLTGFYAGAFAEYRLNYWFGVQAEALYSAQGVKYFPVSNVELKYKQDYINVPILAKFYILDNLSVDLGPQFGFLVNDDAEAKVGNWSANYNTDTKSFDFSVAMGLNYTLFNHLDITARYNLGLTDTYGNINGTNRNGVIQVGLGYRF